LFLLRGSSLVTTTVALFGVGVRLTYSPFGDFRFPTTIRELQIDGAGEQVSHNIEALLNDVKGGAVETILTDLRRKAIGG
jgi:hypothetical protein